MIFIAHEMGNNKKAPEQQDQSAEDARAPPNPDCGSRRCRVCNVIHDSFLFEIERIKTSLESYFHSASLYADWNLI